MHTRHKSEKDGKREGGGWRKSGPSSVKDDDGDDDLNASSKQVGDLKHTEAPELDARDM